MRTDAITLAVRRLEKKLPRPPPPPLLPPPTSSVPGIIAAKGVKLQYESTRGSRWRKKLDAVEERMKTMTPDQKIGFLHLREILGSINMPIEILEEEVEEEEVDPEREYNGDV